MPLFQPTLRALMKRRLEPARALPLFRQILNGVEAAHQQGVWHRDLKPATISWWPTSESLILPKPYCRPPLRPHLGTGSQTSPTLILNEMFTGELLRGTGHKRIDAVAPDYAYLDLSRR
jgi:serine/threonine protein kinase